MTLYQQISVRALLLLAGLFLCLQTALAREPAFPPGASQFVFSGWNETELTVQVAAPGAITPETPIVFVMHGNSRNADTYRDNWLDLVAENDVLVIAPWFQRDQFPKNTQYNLGWVLDEDGSLRPEDQWTFSALDPLFDHVVARTGSAQTGYALFGHSAGSQFVHRFLYHKPEARVHHAILANAGWYTMPDREQLWPYGLKGTSVSDDALRVFYGRSVTVLLGDQDTDPQGRSLRRTPEAMLQGPHRFARGKTFYRASQAKADALETPFNWTLQTVPGVDHDNARMAPPALQAILKALAGRDRE